MFQELKNRIRVSPVLSGGLSMLAVVVALLVLFVLGAAAGSLWDRATGRTEQSGFSSKLGSNADSTSVGAVGVPAQGAPGGSASAETTSTTATPSDVAADVMGAARKPSEAAGRSARLSPSWLDGNFGVGAAPATLAGLTRTSVGSTDNTITAVYVSSTPGASVQSARLVVARVPRSMRTAAAASALLAEFDLGRVTYDWGGREITQGMTNESRLDLYPPALCLVWPAGDYVVQMTAIPSEPGQATAARAQSLKAVNVLPY